MRSANNLVFSLLNGVESSLASVEDRAFQYGDGLFETMLMLDGEIKLWSLHMQRLLHGCSQLKIDPPDHDVLNKEFTRIAQQYNSGSYMVKLMVSRGVGGRGLCVPDHLDATRVFLIYRYQKDSKQTAKKLKICNNRLLENEILGGVKHLNRLPYIIASQELGDFDEGVMLNSKGNVIECITHNIFGIQNDVLVTPMITNCGVKGIMRQQVINRAQELEMKVKECSLSVKLLKKMDACFITNAVVGLQVVGLIEDVHFNKNHDFFEKWHQI